MLLDKYGVPINNRTALPDKRPQGQGGGYKRVEADGFGKSLYRDYDPTTGILREIQFNGDGTMSQRRWQNVQAIADFNKMARDNFKRNPNSGMQCQAILPPLIHEQFMEKCGFKPGNGGEYDKKKMDQLLNDPDYSKFKARPGRVSVQQQRWY